METLMPRQSDSFLHQNSSYYGQIKPENLLFNSNLQEFTRKASYICCLQTAGKLSPADSYKQIKSLWKDLKQSRKMLGIGQKLFTDEEKETGE